MFVDGTGRGGPFDDHVAGLDVRVTPYAPERLVVANGAPTSSAPIGRC